MRFLTIVKTLTRQMLTYNCAIFAPLLILWLNCSVSGKPGSVATKPQKDLPSARIFGGNYAYDLQFPYQVSLQIRASHKCGGSIISKNYVVTAAHCVTYRRGEIVPVSLLTIRAGSTQVDVGGVIKRISKVIRHPDYFAFMSDIALLNLSTPLIYSDFIKSIPLASNEPPNGVAVVISGWGRTNYGGSVSLQLKSNTLRAISNVQCRRMIGIVPNSVLCLAHARGNGACQGDSGGPAAYNNTLVGVANFVIDGCGSSNPDGYAKISSLREWIIKFSDVE